MVNVKCYKKMSQIGAFTVVVIVTILCESDRIVLRYVFVGFKNRAYTAKKNASF